MFTVQQLINQTDVQIDDNYNNSTYFVWFQDAINDLADICYLPTKVEDVVADNKIALPTNFKAVIRMLNADKETYYTQIPLGEVTDGYYILGDYIYFPGADDGVNITLFYDKYPTSIQSIPEQELDFPERFQELLKIFACRQAMLLEDEVAYEERYRMFRDSYDNGKLVMKIEMERLRSRDVGHSSVWRVVR